MEEVIRVNLLRVLEILRRVLLCSWQDKQVDPLQRRADFFPSLPWCTSRVARHDEQIHDRVRTSRTSVRQSDSPRPVEHGRFPP